MRVVIDFILHSFLLGDPLFLLIEFVILFGEPTNLAYSLALLGLRQDGLSVVVSVTVLLDHLLNLDVLISTSVNDARSEDLDKDGVAELLSSFCGLPSIILVALQSPEYLHWLLFYLFEFVLDQLTHGLSRLAVYFSLALDYLVLGDFFKEFKLSLDTQRLSIEVQNLLLKRNAVVHYLTIDFLFVQELLLFGLDLAEGSLVSKLELFKLHSFVTHLGLDVVAALSELFDFLDVVFEFLLEKDEDLLLLMQCLLVLLILFL